MKFLTLSSAIFAAALAIPLLLLLYFLKLRRRELPISSTLLWKKAVMDLQVNAPFQKLRKNLLLFLQLAVLLLAILSLGTPMMRFKEVKSGRKILLVDHSASMSAIEKDASRLELAKRAAAEFVRQMDRNDEAMVIAFSERAQVVCPFSKDRAQIRRQIEAIEPSDGLSKLGDALQLAMAYANPSRILELPGMSPPTAAPEAEIELFSDGRLSDADNQTVQRGGMKYFRIGDAADNVGIVRMDVRRSYERPAQLTVFVTVNNHGPTSITTDVTIKLDGFTKGVKDLTLGPPRGPNDQNKDLPPSSRDVAFELEHDGGGVIEVSLARDDALSSDNAARTVIDPPRAVTALCVTDREPVQDKIMKVLRVITDKYSFMTPAEFEAAPTDKLIVDGRSLYDVVIFDNHSTAKVGAGGYIFLGGVPLIEGVSLGDAIEDDAVSIYDDTHPIMRYVNIYKADIARWRDLKVPPYAATLIEGERTTIAAYLALPGKQFVITAFEAGDTNFFLLDSCARFLYNATRHVTGGGAAEANPALQPGQTFVGPTFKAAESVEVRRPDGQSDNVPITPGQRPAYTRTNIVGEYTMKSGEDQARFAVNLVDENESQIAPRSDLTVGAEAVSGGELTEEANQPVWPWLVAAALGVIMFEWWVYNRRVML